MAWTQRTELLVGGDRLRAYATAHVLLVGTGGVGAFVAEFLARAGLGSITLVDGDVVSETNRNRQLLALCSTEGQAKVEVLRQRLMDINHDMSVIVRQQWINTDNVQTLFEDTHYQFVVDAIDDVPAKCALLKYCVENGVSVVAAMGAAGKYDPSLIQLSDISKSHHCPLAKAVRKRLLQDGINTGIPVVFSPEPADLTHHSASPGVRTVPGTLSYMPAAFACHISAYVLSKL